ncbi:hypothetical protein [Rhizobium rhizogenes]|uniref:hypothetical protein n=1 Tax=Rhizobium rhizogenes TaxID=359 RepID=UPI002271424A|nr:hypothetical protein [Rhizobium rhizogenes]
MQKLEELIAALEKATGPNYELERLITEVSGYPNTNRTADGHIPPNSRFPNFTASVDAALALIGDDEFELTNLYGVARVTVHNQGDFGPSYGSHDGGSLPIAICIAALRAKLHQEKNNAE